MNWDEVHAEHHAAFLRWTTSRCGDLQAAADIVSEAFAEVWKDRAKYAPARGSVGDWLNAICRSTIADYYRLRSRLLPHH